jgi:apolipoprotein N-acyltransferase
LICFEDLFPSLPRRFVKEGAQWLVVITNDAWFGRSAASLQHLQASVFRAVESRVWVVRAANTGWSGFIDPSGRRLPHPHQIPRFKAGVAQATLRLGLPRESRYNKTFGGK